MVATAGNDESCDDPPPGWIGIVTMVSEPSDPLQPTKTLAPDISLQIPMAKRRHPFQTPTPTSAYMLFVVFLFLLLSCHQTLTRLPPTLRLQSTPVPPTSSTLAATSTSPMKSTPTQIPYSPPLTPKMPHLLRCFRCRLPHPSLPSTLLASSPPSLGPVAPPAIKTLALTNGTTHPILLVLSISRSQTLASSSPSSIATLTSSESLFTALGFFSPKSTQNPNSNTAFFTSKSIKLSILFRNPFPSPVNFLISPFSHLPPSFLHLLKICVQIAKAILTLHSVVAKRYRILELSSSSSILSPDSFDTANSISDCYFSKSHDSLFLAAIADGSVQLYDLLDSSLLQPPNPVNGYRSPNPPSSHRRCLQRRHGHRGLKKPPPRRSSQSPETLSLTSVSEGSPHPLSPSPWARNASTTPTGLRWTQSRSTLTTKGKPHSLLPLSLNLISPTLSSTSGAAESNRYVFGASSSPISNSTASTSNSPPRVRSNSSSVSTDLGSSIWKQISARRVFHEIPQRDSASLTAMVFCYTDNGNMSASRKLSDQMLVEEINFWSALILCCSDSGLWKDSLRLCCEMLPQHVKPNLASLSILMFANIELGNSLVNRYAKCGGAPEVYLVFTDFPLKDVVSYNVMIPGFTSHGHGQEASKLFSEMLKVGICPDTITFLGMLYACNQVRNLELVQYYYNHMKEDYGVEPFVDHYACMVDLYGRTGSIDKAYDLVKTMPVKHHAKVWGALLKACSIHSHVGISEMLITSIFGHNEDGGIQENCINLVGRIANRGAEIVPVREWMRICFELPEMLKAHQKGIRSVTVTTTRFRKGTRSHQPSSCINLVPIRRLL